MFKEYPYKVDDGREDVKAVGDRVFRGGSFGNFQDNVRCAFRFNIIPFNISKFVGVCVSPVIKSEL